MDRTPVVDKLVGRVLSTEAPFSETAEKFKERLRQRKNTRGRYLAPKTLAEYQRMVDIAVDAWGLQETAQISRGQVAEFLDRYPDRAANAYRALLHQLFKYAVGMGLRDDNPVMGTLQRVEVVERQRLTLPQFQKIYEAADPWFQRAMELALQTLQRREDLVHLRFDDEREPGWLFVDQRKVEGHGTGHIRIHIGRELRRVIQNCRDDVICPYMVHKRPERTRREYLNAKDHPFQVTPEMVTRKFKELRDKLNVAATLSPQKRPSFHEIRSLGADLYRKAGHSHEAIQRLLGHSSVTMTEEYLNRRGQEEEARYVDATAGLAIDRRK